MKDAQHGRCQCNNRSDDLRPPFCKISIMPSILKVQQHIADSLRAVQWFKMTRDSSYIKKYKQPAAPSKKDTSAPAKDQRFARAITEALLPKEIISFQKKTTTT